MLDWLFGTWRRAVRDVGTLPLWEVLRRRGTRRLANEHPPALRFAAERCMTCPQPHECERLLAAGHDEKIGAFCPNATYLRHLDAMREHAPKRE